MELSGLKLLEHIARNDISRMSDEQKVDYYIWRCEQMGLDHRNGPLQFIRFVKTGAETLYIKSNATDELALKRNVSRVTKIPAHVKEFPATTPNGPKVSVVYCVVTATMANRSEDATATLPWGDPFTVLMKCETKAKRRATLAITASGIIVEDELDSIPGLSIVSAPKALELEPYAPQGLLLPEQTAEYIRLGIEACRSDPQWAVDAAARASILHREAVILSASLNCTVEAARASIVEALRNK
jgi:hypothetical protein